MNTSTSAPARFLDMREVCALLHLSRARINQLRFGAGKPGHRNEADPTFPKAIKLAKGPKARILWREKDVVAWAERLEAV
jgi:predicted DNA-binding transcriptional regulator AlpA